MSKYRELSRPARLEEPEGEWVDFPASPDPDPWAALLKTGNHLPPGVSCGRDQDAKRAGGVMMTFVAIALRGLLVTTAAVATIAYLLLTNSHI
jgi:hypothetical protein